MKFTVADPFGLKRKTFRSGVYCLLYSFCLLVFFLLKHDFDVCMRLFVIGIECFLVFVLVRLVVNMLRRRYLIAALWVVWFMIGATWLVSFCVNGQSGLESAAALISDEMAIQRSKLKNLCCRGGIDSVYVFMYEGVWNSVGFVEVTLHEEKRRIISHLNNLKKQYPLIEFNHMTPLFYKYTPDSTYIIYVIKNQKGWTIFYIGI